MKKLLLLLIVTISGIFVSAQQADFGFSYQAVIRNTDGQVLANRSISIRTTILSKSISGNAVCTEIFATHTNRLGLIELEIGSADKQTFQQIDWADGPFFLKVEVDLEGNGSYHTLGTSKIHPVPYALYAEKSGTLAETDPVFTHHPSSTITSETINQWNSAYSWGPHAGKYLSVSYRPRWSDIDEKPTGNNIGDMLYWNGSEWVAVEAGRPGQYLQLNSEGKPVWSGKSAPAVNLISITNIDENSATTNSEVTDNGGYTVTERGVCWSESANPTTADSKVSSGSGTGSYSIALSGLATGTTYHVRSYAINTIGTAYSAESTFTPTAPLASVETSNISEVTATTATAGGNVTGEGTSSVTARGVCWSTSTMPSVSDNKTTNGTGTGSFSSSITGLTPNTTYYVRAYATNSSGTAYGFQTSFTTQEQTVADNSHTLLGNPSNATHSTATPDNYLMEKPQYTLSYNKSKQTANWVCWHLYSGDIGSTPRQNDFREDNTLPGDWYHVGAGDYQYSTYGFDRGHMCPSADRTNSVSSNSATFLMTNMIPQAPNNNQRTWGDLERYTRDLIDQGKEVYIISGPYGRGGTSAKGTFEELSSGVVVPNKTWKIIVVLTNGDNDLSRITTSTRVIAVLMPNDQTCSEHEWRYYRVSVDEIETLTGYDFLSNIATSIQDVIESRVDTL